MEQMQQPFCVGIAVAAHALKFVIVKDVAKFQVFHAYPSHTVHQLVPA